jgi:hypothetical protein
VPDIYPDSLIADLKDLRKRVEELEALQSARAPLTEASKGWLMSDMAIPSVPSGKVHVGCNDGQFFVRDSDGTTRRLAAGVAVGDPSYNLTNATPSYVQGQAQTVVDTLDALFTAFTALKASLEDINVINT